jgi:hypothetical protein
MTFDEFKVRQFFLVDSYKKLCKTILIYFFHVLLNEFKIRLDLFFMFVSMRSDINKMSLCVELQKWSEHVKGVRCHTRERLNSPLQLQVVGLEHLF